MGSPDVTSCNPQLARGEAHDLQVLLFPADPRGVSEGAIVREPRQTAGGDVQVLQPVETAETQAREGSCSRGRGSGGP